MTTRRWAAAALVFSGACASQVVEPSQPAVFGNEGAVVEARPAPDPATARAAGPCTEIRPPGDRPLLDDFEDGDHQAFKVSGREGWWWSASDGTPDSRLHPAPGAFAPEPLPDPEASRRSAYAAHLSAEGQKGWGVAWGTSLRWVGDGLECPFNASQFAGVRLRAKGPGELRLSLLTPPTVPVAEDLGECEGKCWDVHGHPIRLTDQWQELVVPFARLQQGGWGDDAEFDAARLLGVQFMAGPDALPLDWWVDDLAFVTQAEIEAWYAEDAPKAAPRDPS